VQFSSAVHPRWMLIGATVANRGKDGRACRLVNVAREYMVVRGRAACRAWGRAGAASRRFHPGAGGSTLTWQIASGLGYHTSWSDLSLTWRYLLFDQDSGFLRHLSANGPMIMASFTF
jgi:hypothetical protein